MICGEKFLYKNFHNQTKTRKQENKIKKSPLSTSKEYSQRLTYNIFNTNSITPVLDQSKYHHPMTKQHIFEAIAFKLS